MIQAQIVAEDLQDEDLGRCVYMCAGALSTALRRHGVDAIDLYQTHRTSLAGWAAEVRGNYLWLVALLVWTIAESDRRRGAMKTRGGARYDRARRVATRCLSLAGSIPAGTISRIPPKFL